MSKIGTHEVKDGMLTFVTGVWPDGWPKEIKTAWKITLDKWRILSRNPVHDGGPSTEGFCMMFWNPISHADYLKRTLGCDPQCPLPLLGYPRCEGTPGLRYKEAYARGEDPEKLRHLASEHLRLLERIRRKSGVMLRAW
jgi:hypothetical protein